jgi:hypothetical protein
MTNKNYKLYYYSRAISGAGDALQEIAIIAIIASLTESVTISGIIVTLNAIVCIMCSLFVIKHASVARPQRILTSLNYIYAVITSIFYLITMSNNSSKIFVVCVVLYETICSLIYTFYKIYKDTILKEVTDSNEKIARLFATDNVIKIATSLISTALLLFMSYKAFLILNALSFVIAGYLISKLKVNIVLNEDKVISNNLNRKLVENIRSFYFKYINSFRLVIISAILSFFFASYKIVFQKTLIIFNLKIEYVGILNSVYYLVSIILSYIAGFLNIENIKKNTLITLFVGFSLSLFALTNLEFIVISYILILYPIVGAGYNTIVQIYFQNNINRDDIPVLKGIYNIICGASIFLSGIVTPNIVQNINIFFFIMATLFALLFLYVFKKLINE